jgi:hypothetical protein
MCKKRGQRLAGLPLFALSTIYRWQSAIRRTAECAPCQCPQRPREPRLCHVSTARCSPVMLIIEACDHLPAQLSPARWLAPPRRNSPSSDRSDRALAEQLPDAAFPRDIAVVPLPRLPHLRRAPSKRDSAKFRSHTTDSTIMGPRRS